MAPPDARERVVEAPPPPPSAARVVLRLTGERRRWRPGVLLRGGLVLPHLLLLELWWIVLPFAIPVAWWCALLGGRLPGGLHRFLVRYARVQTRVSAYALLLADPFPGFGTRRPYPGDLRVPDTTSRGRLRTLAYLPVLVVAAVPALLAALVLVALIVPAWLWCLVAGRMPRWMQRLGGRALGLTAAYNAFLVLATDRIPLRIRVDREPVAWRSPQEDDASVPPAAARAGCLRGVAQLGAVAAVGVGVVVAVLALRHTTVPGDLRLPSVDAARAFGADAVDAGHAQNTSDAWLLGGMLASLAALALLARGGARRARAAARHSAAGPVGTGLFVGALATGAAGLAALPFAIVAAATAPGDPSESPALVPLNVLSSMATAGIVVAIAMGTARRLPRTWWVVAPLVLALLLGGMSLVIPSLDEGTELKGSPLAADARQLARREGVDPDRVKVIDLRDETRDDPVNAFAVSGGSSSEVVLVGALSGRRELRVVLGHEIGHIARGHTWRLLALHALFLLLAAGLVQIVVTRRRGAMTSFASVPLAVLVVAVVQLAWTPVTTGLARRYEAEADWISLGATRDPHAFGVLQRELVAEHDAPPTRPWWARAMFDDHPDPAQRLAMGEAWSRRQRAGR